MVTPITFSRYLVQTKRLEQFHIKDPPLSDTAAPPVIIQLSTDVVMNGLLDILTLVIYHGVEVIPMDTVVLEYIGTAVTSVARSRAAKMALIIPRVIIITQHRG